MIQAFSPKAADNPLHIAVLPRTTGSDWKTLHTKTNHTLLKMMAIDPVTIPDQKAWWRIPRKCRFRLKPAMNSDLKPATVPT